MNYPVNNNKEFLFNPAILLIASFLDNKNSSDLPIASFPDNKNSSDLPGWVHYYFNTLAFPTPAA